MTHNAQLTKACLTFMLPLPFVQAKLDGPPRLQLKVRGTQWTSSSKLFLKIPVLQAHFCWLGDLEKIICPWKESVSGTIQGVYVYLMSGIAAIPPPPARPQFCLTSTLKLPSNVLTYVCWETS